MAEFSKNLTGLKFMKNLNKKADDVKKTTHANLLSDKYTFEFKGAAKEKDTKKEEE